MQGIVLDWYFYVCILFTLQYDAHNKLTRYISRDVFVDIWIKSRNAGYNYTDHFNTRLSCRQNFNCIFLNENKMSLQYGSYFYLTKVRIISAKGVAAFKLKAIIWPNVVIVQRRICELPGIILVAARWILARQHSDYHLLIFILRTTSIFIVWVIMLYIETSIANGPRIGTSDKFLHP